jgi:hypothetical protein
MITKLVFATRSDIAFTVSNVQFENSLFKNPASVLGPVRACKVRARVGIGLYTAGSGFCRPGLAWWGARGLDCRLSPKNQACAGSGFWFLFPTLLTFPKDPRPMARRTSKSSKPTSGFGGGPGLSSTFEVRFPIEIFGNFFRRLCSHEFHEKFPGTFSSLVFT